jgi:hypothetical protein
MTTSIEQAYDKANQAHKALLLEAARKAILEREARSKKLHVDSLHRRWTDVADAEMQEAVQWVDSPIIDNQRDINK